MGIRIDVKDLNIYYGDFLAVANLCMSIDSCRITALIGPSGTGKSSVLRALNRLHEVPNRCHVEGHVMLGTQDIYAPGVDPTDVRRLVGMVFQRPNPFPTMSIYENAVAGLILSPRRVPKRVLDETAEWSLRKANLWDEVRDRLKTPALGLSGGQQQRLCVARAIAVQPQVLLMDEPASALDPMSTFAIEDLMQTLKDEITIVVVTHNLQQAARVSDSTAFFNLSGPGQPGELIEMDDTETIFTNPSDSRTSDYVSGRFG